MHVKIKDWDNTWINLHFTGRTSQNFHLPSPRNDFLNISPRFRIFLRNVATLFIRPSVRPWPLIRLKPKQLEIETSDFRGTLHRSTMEPLTCSSFYPTPPFTLMTLMSYPSATSPEIWLGISSLTGCRLIRYPIF